jgi:hypothetical protein
MTQETSKYILPHFTLYSDGRLYNHKTKKFKKWSNSNGYMVTSILENGRLRFVRQHRLLAESFIPNIEQKKDVNHINGIKNDNRLENIEWATRSENMKHAFDTGLKNAKTISKKVVDRITGEEYDSITEAAIIHNINRGNLSKMLTGKRKNKTNLQSYNN